MPILSMSAGRVTAIWGSAFYRQPDGSLRPVHVGDEIISGQQILTDQKGIVEIEPAELSLKLTKLLKLPSDVDHTLKAIEAPDIDVVPAAGVNAAGSGSLLPGTRVERVSEVLSPDAVNGVSPQAHPLGRVLPLAQTEAADVDGAQTQSGPSLGNTPPPDSDVTLPPGEHGSPLLAITVSEKGLTSGSAQDPTLTTQTVQLQLADLPSTAGLHLVAPSTPLVGADGQAWVWVSDGHGGLQAKSAADPTGSSLMTAELDAATGKVVVSLLGALQHQSPGADALTLSFDVRTSDATAPELPSVAVTVQDDVPTASADLVAHVTTPAANVMIMLDVSGHMARPIGSVAGDPLQTMVQAVGHLLDQYEQAGQVAVRLVTFADSARTLGDHWVSVSEAKTLLSGLTAHGALYYDTALPVGEAAFLTDAGKLPDAQNVSYLFAGGPVTALPLIPVGGQPPANPGLGPVDASEEAAWTRFLSDHHIVSHAVGVGPWVKAADLDPIAYDGHQSVDLNASVVPNPVDLGDLQVDTLLSVVHGSLLDGVTMGADGLGQVQSVTVDGHTHLGDTALPNMVIQTGSGGELTIDVLTGQYTYVAPSHAQAGTQDAITYTLSDRDGDKVTAGLKLVLNSDQASSLAEGQALDLRDLLQSDHAVLAGMHGADHAGATTAAATATWGDLGLSAHAASVAVVKDLLDSQSTLYGHA